MQVKTLYDILTSKGYAAIVHAIYYVRIPLKNNNQLVGNAINTVFHVMIELAEKNHDTKKSPSCIVFFWR